jgi:hypothetical protein
MNKMETHLEVSSGSLMKSVFRIFLVLLLVFPPTVLRPPSVEAQDLNPLGTVLDGLQARVDAILNNARSLGLELVLVLGQQIASEISLARQQLHAELDFQRAQWGDTAAQLIDNMTKAIDQLETQALGQAQDFINQAQLAAISLPFSDKTPHVRGFSPIIAFRPPPGVDDLVFTVAGVFPEVGTPNYSPTLTLDAKDPNGNALPAFPASSANAFSAQFHVPSSSLVFPTGSAARSIQAHVNIPYKKTCFLFKCRAEQSIPVLIGLLPQSPGNLHIAFSTTSEHYETKLGTSYGMHQDASRGDDLDHSQTFAPDSGYEVLPNSVQIRVLSADGDWGLIGNCSTSISACWRIKTVQHHCALFFCPQGHDGSVNFTLSFAERRLTTTVQNGQLDIPIEWNQTALHTFPSDGALTWSATYTDFNDRSVSFGSSNTTVNSPYLKAANVADRTYAFSVYPFDVDAGSSLTMVPPQNYSPNTPLNARLETHPENSRNPLTPHGFSTLKAFAAKALAEAFPVSGGLVLTCIN